MNPNNPIQTNNQSAESHTQQVHDRIENQAALANAELERRQQAKLSQSSENYNGEPASQVQGYSPESMPTQNNIHQPFEPTVDGYSKSMPKPDATQAVPVPMTTTSSAITNQAYSLPYVLSNQFKGDVKITNYFILFLTTFFLLFIIGPFDLLMLLTLRQKVTITNDGVEIQGAFSKKFINWSDITQITIAPTPYLYVQNGKKYNISSAFYVKLLSKVSTKRQNDPQNIAIMSQLNNLLLHYKYPNN